MSMEWMDNFSLYGAGGQARMLNGLYAEVGLNAEVVADPSGAAGLVLLGPTVSQGSFRRVFGGFRTDIGFAQRVWFENLPLFGASIIASFRDGSNIAVCDLSVLTTGVLRFAHGPGLATVIFTANPVIVANAWQHVEIFVEHSETVGSVEVRVEGVPVLTATNINTGTGSAQIGNNFRSTSFEGVRGYIKDIICYNGLGSYNNSFLGTCIVASLNPDSDVALNWTPSTGANGFSILDNRPPIDTAFISAADPPPAAYQATLTDLPLDVTSVRALQTVVRAAKVDGGDGNLQTSLVSNGDVANGADRPITSTFTYWFDVFEEDPDTAAPWTPAAADAVQMRLNRTV